MSSQKGNIGRTRAQRHKNSTTFKNTLHDTSHRTKNIISTTQDGLCTRCKEVIEWKIKYKKYKPLTQAATCTRCRQKAVKKAYYTVCQPCASQLGVCAKCAQKKEIVAEFETDDKIKASEHSQMEQEIKFLSERERRTLYRLKEKGQLLDDLQASKDGGTEVEAAAFGIDQLKCEDDDDQSVESDCDGDGDGSTVHKVSAYALFDTTS